MYLSYLSLFLLSVSFRSAQAQHDADPTDPEDQSWVKSWTALGDSYAAGIRSGTRMTGWGDWYCSRYDRSYPMLMNMDDRMGGDNGRTFNFWACSGAVTDDAIKRANELQDGSQDVITISSGGNDALLSEILNECVYQWKSSGTLFHPDSCTPKLDQVRDIVNGPDFGNKIGTLIETAKRKLTPDGAIYYTGYARFFDESDSLCDGVTWSFWFNWGHREYLNSDRRSTMNSLVNRVNEVIEAKVRSAGPQVVFVDYDDFYEDTVGRYCEPGVHEPNDNRYGLLLYEYYTDDSAKPNTVVAQGTPVPGVGEPLLNGTFEWQIDQWIREAQAQNSSLVPVSPFQGGGGAAVAQPAGQATPEQEAIGITSSGMVPDSYKQVFHPRPTGHQLIANLIFYNMEKMRAQKLNLPVEPETSDIDSCPIGDASTNSMGGARLPQSTAAPGEAVKKGTELRILPLGDSITFGFLSGDGNGYRLQLQNDLSGDSVTFAGTVRQGNMREPYMEGYPGHTIQYIAEHCGAGLDQNPNIVLLMAGTNDMNPDGHISQEGSNPDDASQRLGKLIDQINKQLPKTVVLVALLTGVDNNQQQADNTAAYNKLIPGIVQSRADGGFHVATVDMTLIKDNLIRSGDVHPTDDGYKRMGDIWYDALHEIPSDWIQDPIGPNPVRSHSSKTDTTGNGGPDPNIPAPDYGISPVDPGDSSTALYAASSALQGGAQHCLSLPVWMETDKIAQGLGRNGDWHYNKNWVEAGKNAEGFHRDPAYVSLVDMDGDGRADYVWVDPDSGQTTCYLNAVMPNWTPAGTGTGDRTGVIADGTGQSDSVFWADMNGDGKADYLVVDDSTGHVDVYWNLGPDPAAANGWRFNPGGQLASGVPHANLGTLRFPDVNGDGRADYVVIGSEGSVGVWLNIGQPGSFDVHFAAQGGIATGVGADIGRITLDDVNGDGRADYLIWDYQGGITGFLNQPSQREGVPFFVNQGDAKVIADGVGQDPGSIRLADLDGDGKKDYIYLDGQGAVFLWWNRGTADATMAGDGIRFADMDGDGQDDYVSLDPHTGAPTVYLNGGSSTHDSLGWQWNPANPSVIASGGGDMSTIHLADMNGDGLADYVVVDPKSGSLDLYANYGPDTTAANNWRFEHVGVIAQGLGPGVNTRLADVDGDGRADYLQLGPHGELTVYRNVFPRDPSLKIDFEELPGAAASGIGQIPGDISFYDVNGDNKADYIFTSHFDGSASVWLNNYPNTPAWVAQDQPLHSYLAKASAPNQGLSGRFVRWARMQKTGRASYVAVDPNTGAIAAWLNQCDHQDSNPPCKAPLTDAGKAQFVYWESPRGNGGPLSSATVFGITARSDWNTDHLKDQGQPNTFSEAPFKGGSADGFTLDGGGECAQKGTLQFSKGCGADLNYNVLGVHGGIANCINVTDSHTDLLGLESDQNVWEPMLLCTGSICS